MIKVQKVQKRIQTGRRERGLQAPRKMSSDKSKSFQVMGGGSNGARGLSLQPDTISVLVTRHQHDNEDPFHWCSGQQLQQQQDGCDGGFTASQAKRAASRRAPAMKNINDSSSSSSEAVFVELLLSRFLFSRLFA